MKLPALIARLAPTAPVNHVNLSMGALGAITLSMIAAIQLWGDPGAARPKRKPTARRSSAPPMACRM